MFMGAEPYAHTQIVPSRILNVLVLATQDSDTTGFIGAFLSSERLPDAQVHSDSSPVAMATVAVQWGSEVLCVNLTRIPSAARLASSSTFAYERADGLIFVTSAPTVDNVQVLARWRKEVNARTAAGAVPAIFVVQRAENQKMLEKAASTAMIKERGFSSVIQVLAGDSEHAQSVVKHIIWYVMGKKPMQLSNTHGTLLAAASKGTVSFGNLL